MKKSQLTHAMREVRNGQTQEQLAMELNVSRELVSKIENGRVEMAPDISRKLMKRKGSPRLAMALRYEYTGTGTTLLNGPNVDLHRSSVREKTIEEAEEFLAALKAFSFAKPLSNLSNWERPELEKTLEEGVELITAIEHLLLIVCEETGINFTDVWQNHHTQLMAKGYVQ
ncbi:helix-turn-helix domain-containing protein [Planococcus wigleyi]|uniref:Helix-turn-helix transcriptional regulator n=1 Tax=Planococcus wigleyi TaxID=2762216 RepID=A0ABR8WA54_9BACL|nr:helix-turn-helix transcriptional regulator [Planococcus wigleyi]MBD8013852.1 helix-turn-helix transcriptional regulator [Planococcus wigleyi]